MPIAITCKTCDERFSNQKIFNTHREFCEPSAPPFTFTSHGRERTIRVPHSYRYRIGGDVTIESAGVIQEIIPADEGHVFLKLNVTSRAIVA